MSSKAIIQTILEGLIDANETYFEWSGGFFLHGAEYVATFCIASAVWELDNVGYVTVENNVRDSILNAGGTLQGLKKKVIPEGERFDIAVWNKRPRIIGLIEVKTTVYGFYSLKRDVDKICKTLRRLKQRCIGCVAYFSSLPGGTFKSAEDRLSQRLQNIYETAEDYCLSTYGTSVRRHQSRVFVDQFNDEDGSVDERAWAAEVLEIKSY